MASERQLLANRLNARHSTGPRTHRGKSRSRRNALKHGLTARTIIPAIEDEDAFAAFAASIVSSYQVTSPIHRELLDRLAGLLWRLRRAQMMETGVFSLQAKQQNAFASNSSAALPSVISIRHREHVENSTHPCAVQDKVKALASTFLRVSNINGDALDRLTRYETALWRQAVQLMIMLDRFSRSPLP